jgi:hypothetical protein
MVDTIDAIFLTNHRPIFDASSKSFHASPVKVHPGKRMNVFFATDQLEESLSFSDVV